MEKVSKSFEENQFDLEEEVKYFSKYYKKKGNLREIIDFNSELAEKNKKINVSLIWKNLLKIFYPQQKYATIII